MRSNVSTRSLLARVACEKGSTEYDCFGECKGFGDTTSGSMDNPVGIVSCIGGDEAAAGPNITSSLGGDGTKLAGIPVAWLSIAPGIG